MSPLFETIRVEDGAALHLGYHAARMNRSRREIFGTPSSGKSGGPRLPEIDLATELAIPAGLPPDVHRCRVLYGERIDEVTFTPYVPREVRSLSIRVADDIRYDHKFTDRSALDALRRSVPGDDVLIVRGGLVTDTSAANIVFFDGVRWLTPASPLLPGTARARLLDEGRIVAEEIRVGDLSLFSKAVLVNAMIGFNQKRWIGMGEVG